MSSIFFALAAFAGGLTAAVLGWLESHESFAWRKFTASVIRSFIAGVLFAVGYGASAELTVIGVLTAFLAGAGADAMVNRAGGALGNGSFPLSTK